jgi:hypothetical protein
MKNRNSIFIFVIVTIMFSLAKVYFIKDFKVPREEIVVSSKIENLNQLDQKNIESKLKVENIKTPFWEKIVDYRTDLKTAITKENAKGFFDSANKNLSDLVVCLRKDFCGMDKATSSSPYFDSERTPAHLLLARSLKVIRESLIQDPTLASQIDWNLITEISGLSGNDVKAASMDLLVNFDKRNGGKENLYKVAESYSGIAKANFYTEISNDITPEERPLFISTLEKTLSNDDPNTVISIVENFKKYRLTKNEILGVSKILCRFKNDGDQAPNWKMIVSQMKNVDINFEQNCL